MILITHSVVGAALAHGQTRYAAIFILAFASHYLFDMIPHWHYNVPQIKKAVLSPAGKKTFFINAVFAPDIMRIALDLAIGITLSQVLFAGDQVATFIGAFGAVLPDLLVGLSKFWPQRTLVLHDRFHRWMHTSARLDDKPLVGIASQAAIMLFFIWLFR